MLKLCGAKARTNGHQPCRQPAMANGRCRLHGGLVPKHNPGPKTEAGKHRQKMASWKHGRRSKEAIQQQREFREMIKQEMAFLKEVDDLCASFSVGLQ